MAVRQLCLARRQIRPVLACKAMTTIHKSDTALSGYMDRVRICNTGVGAESQGYIPFLVDNKTVGYLEQNMFTSRLLSFTDVFKEHSSNGSRAITLADHLDNLRTRTDAVAEILVKLRGEGLISGWRDELYPVLTSFHEEPVMLLERAASVMFGIKAYGVHVNGFVRGPDGLQLWVARRSKSKPTWPGKLDHIVAGGQPHGLSCQDNVIKECGEEAGIPEALAVRAVPVGAVSYTSSYESGLKRDVLFCYDLELPIDFQPEPQDGEVEEFMLWPLDKVAEVVRCSTEYKDNCSLVIIDFLIRHGYLAPEQPGYLELFTALRSGDCS